MLLFERLYHLKSKRDRLKSIGDGVFLKKNRGKTEKTPSPIDFSTIFRYNMDLCSRGGSGTLNLQSAIAGVMLCRGHWSGEAAPGMWR